MRKRDLFKAAGAGVALLAAPRIGGAEKANKLIFVPTENLGVLDPVVTPIRSTRNHAYLVFDTLYGIDTNWAAQPQMVAGHQVEDDGLTWTLTLRDGLRFHDKEPLLARDVVASIHGFAARIPFAYTLMAATVELSAPDDRTVRFRLKRPFPHLPEALPVAMTDVQRGSSASECPLREVGLAVDTLLPPCLPARCPAGS
jgi:peptide/nickel transport system substrate-binding protein